MLKEQLNKISKAVAKLQAETLIDDDVSGGYQDESFKSAYAEIYQAIDEIENEQVQDAVLSPSHLKYTHELLRELNNAFPISEPKRHVITHNPETGKLEISVWNIDDWDLLEMDNCYEENASAYQMAQAAKGILADR